MMRRRFRIFGAAMLVWIVGAIIGGAVVWYVGERQSAEIRHDHNALICVFRSILIPARARSVQTSLDQTQSPSARARARATVRNDDTILASLLTIPRGFDCSTLKPT